MTTTIDDVADPAARAAVPPPPRWARWAAHAVPLCALPSSLWRIAMAVGIPVGFTAEALRRDYDVPGWGTLNLIGLSLLVECLALLTLGLVSPWGERLPRAVPLVGGRRIPPVFPVVVASLGALAMTLVSFSQLLIWNQVDHGNLSGTGLTVMGTVYAPLLAWGPLLMAVTVSYHLRHRRSR
ncbi:hypothetical protein JL475_23585 [Streptomyces sp. M2CJ-2]|uniref:hypothetical protein n=1 Tax=Streptomyces sp. M2CJ-2 TaxID=2803948 RepID=UPI00192976A7|nr:hypothetical protein [Streptomyces sp. M2CJ-2]MBL3668920.1 hypothetical protein [Streptomyces sp. M2CJ-2]